MREVNVLNIKNKVKDMFIKMNYQLSEDVCDAILEGAEQEKSPIGRDVLSVLLENLKIAKETLVPICQDTGMAIVFAEIGQDVHLTGGWIEDAINQGVREAYDEGYLRKSVVSDPLIRENSNDNTPAVIYYKVIEGDKVFIKATAKGFGSENMSKIKMLKPSQGVEGIIDFVIETVREAGPNPCPPITVGIGIGGTMEKAAQMSKEALIRPLNIRNEKEHFKRLEALLLEKINQLDIGPQGFGGNTTCIGVNIEAFPTHIAGLPVAININCHVSRHLEAEV